MGMKFELIFEIGLGVVVLVTVMFVLIKVFGTAPDCDSLARETALQLKFAIDEVSKDDFPTYTKSDVPTDPTYYTVAPIRLCQEHGEYAYFLQYFGGFPEYQIYYETFPETGFTVGVQHFWNEAYPWSGGAASSFVFWLGMRGVAAGIKYAVAAKVTGTQKFIHLVDSANENIKLKRSEVVYEVLSKPKTTQEFIEKLPDYIEYRKTRDSNIFAYMVLVTEHEGIQQGASDSGYLKKIGKTLAFTDDGFPIISDEQMKIKAPIKIKNEITDDWITDMRQVYVLKDADGNIINWDISKRGDDWVEYTVNPAEEYKKYLNELKRLKANKEVEMLESIYKLPDEVEGPFRTAYDFPNGVADTKLYQKISAPHLDKVKKTILRFKTLGLNVELTTLKPIEVMSMAEAAAEMMDNEEFYDKIIKPTISLRRRIADGILKKFGLVSEYDIKFFHTQKYVIDLYERMAGTIFFPRDMLYNLVRVVSDEVIETPSKAGYNIDDVWNTIWKPALTSKLGGEYYNLFEEKIGEDGIKQLIDRVLIQVSTEETLNNKIDDLFKFEKNVNKEHFRWIMNNIHTDIGKDEYGLLIGFLEQNTDPMPITLSAAMGRKAVKRIVHMQVSAFLVPNSWIYKGIIATQMTEGCEGNSICLYSHTAETPESPYYLDESADKFSLKVWRPVDPLINYANIIGSTGAVLATGGGQLTKIVVGSAAVTSLTQALMWIPSHPRFYVVSPCFAIAKIWKTYYGGEDTIFVKPEKIDMKGKASNYCYADQELVNKYSVIWLATDIGNILEAVVSAGSASLIKSIIGYADISNLIQIVTEAAISWPGCPWPTCPSMTYDTMHSEAGQTAFNDLIRQLKKDGFDY